MKRTHLSAALCLAVVLSLPAFAPAATVTWSSATSGGAWSADSNWSGGSAPAAGSDVILGNATANRTVTYGTAVTNKTVNSIALTETSGYTNQLNVRSSLTVSSGITVSASSGSSILRLESQNNNTAEGFQVFTSASSPLLTGSVTVGSGGELQFSRVITSTSNTTSPLYLAGDLTLNGGTLTVYKYVKTTSGSSYTYEITGNVTMNSGTLQYAVSDTSFTSGTAISDTRLKIGGNLVATGGTITTPTSSSGGIYLYGSDNSLSNVTLGSYVKFTLVGLDQSLSSTVALPNSLVLRATDTSVKTLSISSVSSGNVGSIAFTQGTNGGTTTLRMGSDLKLKSGTYITTSATGSAADGSTVNFVIDTNGHTFDATLGTFSLDNVSSTVSTSWAITGGGTVKALTYDLSVASAGASVGANTTLIATGSGAAINLGNAAGGAIDATSTFSYQGGTGNSATFQSNRNIGHLSVDSGTLSIIGDNDFTAQGGVSVAAGAQLSLGSRTVSADSWTIGLGGSASGLVSSSGAFVYDGALTLNFDSIAALGDYQVFSFASQSGSLDSVTITGAYNVTMSNTGGVWSGIDMATGYTFTLSEELGTLSVVPEPSTVMLAGLAGALILVVERRVRRRR